MSRQVSKKAIVVNKELSNDIVLQVDNLSIAFGGLKAVDNLSFNIKKNEIFGLIGPNGAGKTTVFNCITQFYRPNNGEVYFRTKRDKVVNLVGRPVYRIIRLGLVRTFQNVELIRELSVLDNLLVGAHIKYKTGFISHMLKTKKARKEELDNRKKAIEVLKYLGIDHLKDFLAAGLSYGILKRVELGRALMSDPNLLILDEPAAGLNETETEQLAETIRKIRDDFNSSILLVEHDMRLVMNICDRICAISFGKLLAIGTPKEIQSNKNVQEAYLGKDD
ncbi:MAG: Branched-chain amino acid transport ATP-binding protein LivG [Haloplasmataceae bacterium]|jgi:branched-chain amino acid transport system ATP-binding protein|nr:Branched-chain amino acid transport ATP-binding protein LivG [Haloplasmataceae bacterium]